MATFEEYLIQANSSELNTQCLFKIERDKTPFINIVQSEWYLGEIGVNSINEIYIEVIGSNLSETINIYVESDKIPQNDYFSIEKQFGWNDLTGGIVKLTFKPLVSSSDYTVNLVVESGIYKDLMPIIGKTVLPSLWSPSNDYEYNISPYSEFNIIPIVGKGLTDEIRYFVDPIYASHIILEPDAQWDPIKGGNLFIKFNQDRTSFDSENIDLLPLNQDIKIYIRSGDLSCGEHGTENVLIPDNVGITGNYIGITKYPIYEVYKPYLTGEQPQVLSSASAYLTINLQIKDHDYKIPLSINYTPDYNEHTIALKVSDFNDDGILVNDLNVYSDNPSDITAELLNTDQYTVEKVIINVDNINNKVKLQIDKSLQSVVNILIKNITNKDYLIFRIIPDNLWNLDPVIFTNDTVVYDDYDKPSYVTIKAYRLTSPIEYDITNESGYVNGMYNQTIDFNLAKSTNENWIDYLSKYREYDYGNMSRFETSFIVNNYSEKSYMIKSIPRFFYWGWGLTVLYKFKSGNVIKNIKFILYSQTRGVISSNNNVNLIQPTTLLVNQENRLTFNGSNIWTYQGLNRHETKADPRYINELSKNWTYIYKKNTSGQWVEVSSGYSWMDIRNTSMVFNGTDPIGTRGCSYTHTFECFITPKETGEFRLDIASHVNTGTANKSYLNYPMSGNEIYRCNAYRYTSVTFTVE